MADDIVLHHPEILELIPHRPPFLLIDRVQNITPHESATGVKAITSTEPHLAGHFPGHPIMPGVLTIEAMAQTAGVLIANNTIRANRNISTNFSAICNNGGRMNCRCHYRPGSTIMAENVADATVLPSIEATPSNLNNIPLLAEIFTSRCMVSPGRAGARNFTLSMVVK